MYFFWASCFEIAILLLQVVSWIDPDPRGWNTTSLRSEPSFNLNYQVGYNDHSKM